MVLFICVIWESRSRWRVAWYWSGWGETFLSFVKYHNSFCSAGAYWEAFACTSALTGSALLSPSPITMVICDLMSGTSLWGYILHWENDSTPHSEFSLCIWTNKREVIGKTREVSYHLDWSMKLHVRGFPFQLFCAHMVVSSWGIPSFLSSGILFSSKKHPRTKNVLVCHSSFWHTFSLSLVGMGSPAFCCLEAFWTIVILENLM